jgi:YD repeat-containing protein
MLLNSLSGTATYLTSTQYDASGRVELRAYGFSSYQTDYQYYDWDIYTGQGRLQNLTTSSPGGGGGGPPLQNLSYTYDQVGNLKTIQDALNSNQKQCFTYDALDRLTKATTSTDSAQSCTTQLGNGNYDESYTYDPTSGNLSSKAGVGYTYNAQVSCAAGSRTIPHAVSAAGANSYSYDCNGNMTQRVIGSNTFTLSGACPERSRRNAENRLTAVSGEATASFVYDGDGRRVKATVGGVTTTYIGLKGISGIHLINRVRLLGLAAHPAQEGGGVQAALQQVGEVMLAEDLQLAGHLGRRARPAGLGIVAALEVAQVFQRSL